MTHGFPSVQTRILYSIVVCGYAARKGLLPLAGNAMALSRGVRFLLASCYISEYAVTEPTRSGWKARETYYRPTKAGIDYLASQADNFPAEAQWVRYLPDRIDQSRLVKSPLLFGHDRILRYLTISSTSMFTAAAGCNVQVLVPSDIGDNQNQQNAGDGGEQQANCEADIELIAKQADCEADGKAAKQTHYEVGGCETAKQPEAGGDKAAKPGTGEAKNRTTIHLAIRDLLYESTDQEQNSNGTIMNSTSNLFFIDAYQVKESLRERKISSALLRVGRYTGLVESPFKTVLLYAGRSRGMGWSKSSVDSDVRAFQAYVNLVSRYHTNRPGEYRGVLLVANAKMFEDLYKDKERKRAGKKFAEGFQEMLIFPMTEEGATLFGQYMTVDNGAYRDELVDAAVASGVYERNSGSLSNIFPLVNASGVRMAVGLFIDAIQIQQLLHVHNKDGEQMGMVCYEWQTDYYSRVLPENTLFMTVS